MTAKTREIMDWQNPEQREALLDICAAAAAGDRNAQRRIVEQIFDTVTATVSYGLNCRVFADDAVQDALLDVLDSLRYYRGDCSLHSWARRITLRIVARRVKKQRRREALMFFAPRLVQEPIAADQHASIRQMRIQLNGLLMRLPLKLQTALRLRYVHEHSIREISEIVEAPEETVRDRIKNARKQMRKLMAGNPAFDHLWDEGSPV